MKSLKLSIKMKEKYIVVMLVKRPHNAYLAKEFIVNASKIIYDYMVR